MKHSFARCSAMPLIFFLSVAAFFSCAKTATSTNGVTPTHPDTTHSVTTIDTPAANTKTWVVTTLAGSGVAGYTDGDSTAAAFNNPQGIAVDNQGNLFVGDVYNTSIRKITPAGEVSTYVSDAISSPNLLFGNFAGIVADQEGDLFTIDANLVRKIKSSVNTSVFAGQLLLGYKDGNGSNADFNVIFNLAIDKSGNLFVPDYDSTNAPHIRIITPTGDVSTMTLQDNTGITGNGLPNYYYLYAIAVNPLGGFYVTSNGNNMIKKIDAQGNVSIFAGWTIGFVDGPGNSALFGTITGMACDSVGNLFVADATNHAIRKVSPGGVVSTIAGNGTAGYLDGDSTKAEFNYPFGIAVDKNGAVYVTDNQNSRIRKLVYK